MACAPREAAEVRVRGRAGVAAEVAVGEAEPVPARASVEGSLGASLAGSVGASLAGSVGASLEGGELLLSYGGRTASYLVAWGSGVLWLGRDGRAWAVREEPRVTAHAAQARDAGGVVTSPMPGTVLAVNVSEGQEVASGQPLVVVEAMKMEHAVVAPLRGTIAELTVKAGQQVAMDETLAVIRPAAS
jgi:acetyl-CoA/propionyl-CoA carboxylase biotin carboxyl carrier protein